MLSRIKKLSSLKSNADDKRRTMVKPPALTIEKQKTTTEDDKEEHFKSPLGRMKSVRPEENERLLLTQKRDDDESRFKYFRDKAQSRGQSKGSAKRAG